MLPLALLPLLLKLLLLLEQRTIACTFDHLFVRLPSLRLAFVCFALVCLLISPPFIQLLFVQGHLSLIETPIEVSTCIKTYGEPKLLCLDCNQNIKEDIPTALDVFLCFETKRNETKHKQILDENIHASREQCPRKNWVRCLKITLEGLP